MLSPPDQFVVMLLVLLGAVFVLGLVMALLIRKWLNEQRASEVIPEHMFNQPGFPERAPAFSAPIHPFSQPRTWIAIRSRNLDSVREALGMRNVTPCSWEDGLQTDQSSRLFVSPPVAGWILVIGADLPEPGDDVDICFRFISDLSARLGAVQYFHAGLALYEHAWVRAENGRVQRAFAWSGETLWNQGVPTLAENQLQMACPGYGEAIADAGYGLPEFAQNNSERVAALAARWSIDPATAGQKNLGQAQGIAGDARLFGH